MVAVRRSGGDGVVVCVDFGRSQWLRHFAHFSRVSHPAAGEQTQRTDGVGVDDSTQRPFCCRFGARDVYIGVYVCGDWHAPIWGDRAPRLRHRLPGPLQQRRQLLRLHPFMHAAIPNIDRAVPLFYTPRLVQGYGGCDIIFVRGNLQIHLGLCFGQLDCKTMRLSNAMFRTHITRYVYAHVYRVPAMSS